MTLRKLTLALLMAATLSASAANDTKTVTQCTNGVNLTTATDYIITGTTPFSTTGYVDIQNEDAVVIFLYLKPSVAKSYLANIKINGEAAVNGTNCWLEIYKNGAIVYPHTELTFKPLTVYTEANFGGEANNNFTPYNKYTSGSWTNNFKSFKLKRGYMATIGTNANGQGWSKCFIAQDHDLEIDFTTVNYGKYIANREGFIRVFPWRNVTKKGTAGSPGLQGDLNITWKYGWDGGGWHDEEVEYIPQHHHEGWPSWSGINGLNSVNTVLGNNEPDNSGDAREQYIKVDEIESRMFGPNGTWQNEAYSGGLRVGSPAMSGDCRGSWLSTFISLCEKYNCRIDFIADHCYWLSNGGSFYWQMSETYNKYKRPIWITEWNYGANWTSWPGSDTSGSDANQTIELNAIKDIVGNLESHPNVERYAFYNWVQDCRTIVLNGKLTKAGEWYGNLKSAPSYEDANEYTMGWNYWAPSDLELTFSKNTKRVVLNWTHLNGKQTDSVCVQRKIVDGSNVWENIKNLGMVQASSPTYNYDDLSEESGVVYYRIANYDSDSKVRYSNEASVTLGSAQGNDTFQYGKLTITNLDVVTTDFSETFSEIPGVFMGICTNKNTTLYPGNLLTSTTKAKFGYQILPWKNQKSSATTLSKNEEIAFMAMKTGNYKFGDLDCEVVAGTEVKANMVDTTEVVFKQPFPEGVTPIVLVELLNTTLKTLPITINIWGVTNTGFKMILQYEEAENTKSRVAQKVAYMAITPGKGDVINEISKHDLIASDTLKVDTFHIDNRTDSLVYTLRNTYENTMANTTIVAGTGENNMYAATGRLCTYTANGDTLYFNSPKLFGKCQTFNYPAAAILRKVSDVIESDKNSPHYKQISGSRIKRQVDGTSTTTVGNTAANSDRLGYVIVDNGITTQQEELQETTYQLVTKGATIEDITTLINGYLNGTQTVTLSEITTLIEEFLK